MNGVVTTGIQDMLQDGIAMPSSKGSMAVDFKLATQDQGVIGFLIILSGKQLRPTNFRLLQQKKFLIDDVEFHL